MTTLEVVRTVWGGWSGAPAYSIHYATAGNAGSMQGELHTFFTTIKGLFNSGITWNWESGGNTIDTATGAVNGNYSGLTPPSQVAGGGGASVYAAALGAKAVWTTSAVVNHRRLKGHTALVPIAASVFDTDGTLATSFRTTLLGAASTFATNVGTFGHIFSRTHHTSSLITGSDVPDYGSVLRSRK